MATIENLISLVLNEVGYLEKRSNADLDSKTGNAGDANFTKYARDLDALGNFYNGSKQGYPWCDTFVDWCFVETFGRAEAQRLLNQPNRSYGAGVDYSAKYYKNINRWFDTPEVGDQIFFKSASYQYAHTGIVVEVTDSHVYTVEGNTSGASGVISNGGAVCQKRYTRNYANIIGYGRPNWTDNEMVYPNHKTPDVQDKVLNIQIRQLSNGSVGNDVKALQILLNGYGFACGQADREFGSKTEYALKKFQQKYNLGADGIAGNATWNKLLSK